jgi:hypothetical protein
MTRISRPSGPASQPRHVPGGTRPFLELDDLVVDLHPSAPAQDHVHLLLRFVRVAVRKAIAGRDALVAQAGFLELERLGRRAELQVRRSVWERPLSVVAAEAWRAVLRLPSVRGLRLEP